MGLINGAELFLQEKLKAHLDDGLGAIVLRVGGRFRWRLEVHSSLGSIFGDTDDFSFVCALFEPAKRRHIIYSCAVGDRDPMTLPSHILALRANEAEKLTVLVHDYFLISPSYCLLGADGAYRGVPELETTDPAHGLKSAGGTDHSYREWRAYWGSFLAEARNVVCFSESSAAIMQSAYPFLKDRCEVIPHSVVPIEKVRRSSAKSGHVIGILGDIGVQKGAALIQALAAHLPSGTVRGMVVVGRLDPRFEVGAMCIETGAYKRIDIAQLAAKHRISCWLIPSIWPETFSYTTHEALMTGLPVFSFDIGAQGEAVRRASNGRPLPFSLKSNPSRILEQIERELLHGADHPNQNQRPEAGGNRGFAA